MVRFKFFGENILDYPHEITVSNEGDVLVADMYNHRVTKFYRSTDYTTQDFIPFPKNYGFS